MRKADKQPIVDKIKLWAEGCSVQNQYSNKVWLGLAALSTVALFCQQKNCLPEPIRSVEGPWLSLVLFATLAILVIAYCVAYGQALAAAKRAKAEFSNLAGNAKTEAQDLFYSLVEPNFTRVWPLVRTLSAPKWLELSAYVFFKTLVSVIIFGLPALGLIKAWSTVSGDVQDWGIAAANLVGVLSLVALVTCVVAEANYVWGEVKSLSGYKHLHSGAI